MKAMFKVFNNESEWEIFQNVIQIHDLIYADSCEEKRLFKEIQTKKWIDNTDKRPDFISENIMIEMFEVADIVTGKKGKNNSQRKSDARALREFEEFIAKARVFNPNVKVLARGDTRYNSRTDTFTPDKTEEHHNYQAYINNFERICQKHLESMQSYREEYPDKKLGFLIIDDATVYISKNNISKGSIKDAILSLPFYDKNFMRLFDKADVDFVIWAFNNKYLYIDGDYGQNDYLPNIAVISKENFYNKYSRKNNPGIMYSLEK